MTPRVSTADAATWAVADTVGQPALDHADAVAERALAAAQELGRGTSLFETVTTRYANAGEGQLAGRLLEWQQTASFSIDAAGQGSPLRAFMTEFGSPWSGPNQTAAADVVVGDPSGSVLAEAQLKSVGSMAARISDLSQAKYEGMALITPSDHVQPTLDTLDARIAQADPAFLKHDSYSSVQERLGDRLSVDGVAARPASSEQLRDPEGLLRDVRQQGEEVQSDLRRQEFLTDAMGVGAAAVAGGLTAATFHVVVEGVRSAAAVRAGTLSPTAAALAAVSSSGGAFATGAFVSGGGQALRAFGGEVLPEFLTSGMAPFAIARASLAVGSSGLAYARGEMTAAEAAADSAEALARISVVYAFSVIGQAVIPVPILGAVLGGAAGSLCATVATQGLAHMTVLAKEARAAEELIAALEVETAAAIIVMEEERRLIEEASRAFDMRFAEVILPAIDRLEASLLSGDIDRTFQASAVIIDAYGGTPVATSMAEFDDFMSRPDGVLVLGGKAGRATGSGKLLR